MARISKRKKLLDTLIEKDKSYSIKEAVSILKKIPSTKFNQTVDVSMKIKLDQAENPIRGTVSLPHGTGKNVRVAVFCKGDFAIQAKASGADFVGAEDLMKKVAEGWSDFEVAVATPDIMKDMARLGKVLGPKGLMPNPKSGTVTTEIEKTVKELKAGKIEFRMDKLSCINGPIGKLSFDEKALEENLTVFIRSVLNSSPKLGKVENVKSAFLSSTMGPGIKLGLDEFKV